EFRPLGYKVQDLAFLPDGSRLLSRSDSDRGLSDSVELWDRDGNRVRALGNVGDFSLMETIAEHSFRAGIIGMALAALEGRRRRPHSGDVPAARRARKPDGRCALSRPATCGL